MLHNISINSNALGVASILLFNGVEDHCPSALPVENFGCRFHERQSMRTTTTDNADESEPSAMLGPLDRRQLRTRLICLNEKNNSICN